jgi:formamidopyrimidine-DNA glycosylase
VVPELPEVETVRRGLEPVLAGARLARVEARREDLRTPFPNGFVQRLTGARVERLERRGKYILAFLDRAEVLTMHLGMTGRFEINGPSRVLARRQSRQAAPADPKHAHVVFETDAGAIITYFDARRFGAMDLIATDGLGEHPTFARMGPEPLGPEFHAEYLAAAFDGRRQGPKTLLLDQSIVAGLGNIYVCEALFRARLSPSRRAGALSRARLATLIDVIHDVLDEAITAGGSTLRDYAAADGSLGYFQHRFRVYGRAGEPCPTDGCGGVIRRTVQAGRSTFHCPRCQK